MGDIYYHKFPGDYQRDTRHLSLAGHGAYNLLLDSYYSTGKPLPSSIDALVRIVGAQGRQEREAVEAVADEFFPLGDDGFRHNRRADEEIAKRQEFISEQSRKGRLSVEAKRQHRFNHGSTTAQPKLQPEGVPKGQPKVNPPSPSPSPTPEPIPTPKEKPSSNVKPSDAARELTAFLLASLQERIPNLRQPNLAAWERDCDRMLRLDNRDPGEARGIIEWMAGDFWGTVTLSPAKLREHWDKIQAKRQGSNGGRAPIPAAQRDKYAHLEEQP